MPDIKKVLRWAATVAAVIAIPATAAGCGSGASPAASTANPTATTTTTQQAPAATGAKSDDGRTGGTPDEHVDKPGESK